MPKALQGLSDKQRAAFDHASSKDVLFIASGAVRSGKTAACSAAFGLYAAHHPGDHVLVARTEPAAMRNVVWPRPLGIMAAIRAIPGFKASVSSVSGRHININGGESKIWIIGASDQTASDRIAGSTFRSGMVDELTRLSHGEELWQMLWTRFSVEPRKVWATTNPGALRSWVKRIVIDRREKYRARIVSYLMDDNPTLSEETKEGLTEGLIGHNLQRLIHGLWVDATGLVYPKVPIGKMPMSISRWSVGLDWAGSGVYACVLLAHTRSGRGHVVAEYLWDHREKGPLTDVDQVQRTVAWIRQHTDMPAEIFADPTTPQSYRMLFNAHGYRWRDGNNSLLEGIQGVNAAFSSEMLTVDESCERLLQEASEYSWDQKKADKGEDMPEKGNDHLMDSLRYCWSTASSGFSVRRFGP